MNEARTERPRIVAVAVTYGARGDVLLETMQRALAAGADDLIVVLNGVATETKALIAGVLGGYASRVRIVELPVNGGSAVGFAAGIRAASESDAELVWILDDDNWVDPHCLDRALSSLLASKGQYERAAIMCVRETELRALQAGATVHELRPPGGNFCGVDVLQRLGGRLARATRSPPDLQRLVEVPYGPYGGLLIPREYLDLVAGPDRRFVLYSDDYDWTSRLSRAGVRFFLDTGARIEDAVDRWGDGVESSHFVAMLHSDDLPRIYFSLRNSVYFSSRSARTPAQRVRFVVNGAVFSAWVTVKAIRARRAKFMMMYLRASTDAIFGLRTSGRLLPTGIG